MKKQKLTFRQYWKILGFAAVASLTFFVSCKKDKFETKAATASAVDASSVSTACETAKHDAIRKIAQTIIEKATADAKFRELVYSLCYEQRKGDYYITISEILDDSQISNYFSSTEIDDLRTQISEYRCEKTNEPILFIPFLEEIDETDFFDNNNFPTADPIAVFEDDYNASAATSLGYTLVNGSFQIAYEQIDEDFAWENDVWVFLEEEDVSGDNAKKNPLDTATVFTDQLPPTEEGKVRLPNRDEWGGIMQVTNMSIEPWIRGKFEFKYFVHTSGGTLLKERAFGKWRRKNFKNQRWVNFQDYIGVWNQSTWGPMHLERWIEENKGSTQTVTQSFTPCTGCPTTTVTTQIKSEDSNLGATNVQFTDLALPEPGVTTYTLNGLNFRRLTD